MTTKGLESCQTAKWQCHESYAFYLFNNNGFNVLKQCDCY